MKKFTGGDKSRKYKDIICQEIIVAGAGISRLCLLASAFVKTSARQIGAPRRTENRRPRAEGREHEA